MSDQTPDYEPELADGLPDAMRRDITVTFPVALFDRLMSHAALTERSVEGTIRYAVKRLLAGG